MALESNHVVQKRKSFQYLSLESRSRQSTDGESRKLTIGAFLAVPRE